MFSVFFIFYFWCEWMNEGSGDVGAPSPILPLRGGRRQEPGGPLVLPPPYNKLAISKSTGDHWTGLLHTKNHLISASLHAFVICCDHCDQEDAFSGPACSPAGDAWTRSGARVDIINFSSLFFCCCQEIWINQDAPQQHLIRLNCLHSQRAACGCTKNNRWT